MHHALDRQGQPQGGTCFRWLGLPLAHAGQFNCTGRQHVGCYTAAMKRSLQEVVELVVFGLVALLIGTGLLWVVGWVLSLGGLLLKALAGLLWLLLRFVVPVAIVAGIVYFIVKALQGRGNAQPVTAAAGHGQAPAAAPAAPSQAASAPVTPSAPKAAEVAADANVAAAQAPSGPEAPAGDGASAGEQDSEDEA